MAAVLAGLGASRAAVAQARWLRGGACASDGQNTAGASATICTNMLAVVIRQGRLCHCDVSTKISMPAVLIRNWTRGGGNVQNGFTGAAFL